MTNLDLWKQFESQYAVLTSEITSKIGQLKIHSLIKGDRGSVVGDVYKCMEEAHELLEQMDLEVREMDTSIRSKYRSTLDSYKKELDRLNEEFIKAKQVNNYSPDAESCNELYNFGDEQRQRLLDNSEKIERTGNHLKTGYRIALETEEIGVAVLRDLQGQRETVERSRNRLRETDAELSKSARIVNNMIARSKQHKLVIYFIAVVFSLILVLSIYYSVKY